MTQGKVHVRPARPEDEESLRALDRAAWDSSAVFPSVLARLGSDAFFSPDHDADAHLVAELDGAVAGYVRLSPATPLPESSHVLQVNGLAVAPSARGHGIAAALLAATEDRAREQGAAKVTLRVLGTNGVARRVYERAGYVVEGVLRGEFRINGEDVDDYLMARHLAPNRGS